MTFDRTLLFKELDIETVSSCNRVCPTCLRNSSPRDKVADRFGRARRLPLATVHRIVDEAAALGFTGVVNFSHFNEPLIDSRLGGFGAYAKAKGVFSTVEFHSNLDLLTPRRAAAVDGHFDEISAALYDDDSDANRARLQALVPNTPIRWVGGVHIVTHYSPLAELNEYIALSRPQPCRRGSQRRLIIDYRGEMLLCCEDIGIVPSFGNVHDRSLAELWFSEKHMDTLAVLDEFGGRENYGYCRSCPRPNEEND